MRAALAQALFTEPDILLLVRVCQLRCVCMTSDVLVKSPQPSGKAV